MERVWTNAYNQVTNTGIMLLNISIAPKVPCAPSESLCYSQPQPLANISTFCHYSFTFSRISFNRIVDRKISCVWLPSQHNAFKMHALGCVPLIASVFLLPNSVLLYVHTTLCLSVHQMMAIWVVSTFWLLGKKLL